MPRLGVVYSGFGVLIFDAFEHGRFGNAGADEQAHDNQDKAEQERHAPAPADELILRQSREETEDDRRQKQPAQLGYRKSSSCARVITLCATLRPSASPTLTSVGKWIPAQMRDCPASSASAFKLCASRGNR
jgi:hypothetical protein